MVDKRSPTRRLIVFYVRSVTPDDIFFGSRGDYLAAAIAATGPQVALIYPRGEREIELRVISGSNCSRSTYVHFSDLLAVLAGRSGSQNIFVACSAPDVNAFSAIQRLKSSGWRTVYDVDYDLEDMHRLKLISSYHFEVESAIANLVDKVFVSNKRLLNKAHAFGVNLDKCVLASNSGGAKSRKKLLTTIEEKKSSGRPCGKRIVGYLGNLDPNWFDWSLVLSLAHKFVNLKVELIGYNIPKNLIIPDNFKVKNIAELSYQYESIIQKWSVGIIALRQSPASLSINPIVLHEYLMHGIPVVTSPLGEIPNNAGVHVYNQRTEFFSCVEDALNNTADQSGKIFSSQCEQSSWQRSADAFMSWAYDAEQ